MKNKHHAITPQAGCWGLRRTLIYGAGGLLAGLIALMPSGCFGPGRALPTAEALVAAPAERRPVHPVDRLMRGRRILMSSCTECHGIYYPEEFAPEAWPRLAADMRSRSNLSDQETSDVIAYLQTASAAVREKSMP